MSKETPLEEILNDKTIKAKGKASQISKMLLEGELSMKELIGSAKSQSDTNRLP
jgi:hypothetical protein